MSTIKVLVVDDAVVMRMLLTKILNGDPEIEVIGSAANGEIAVKKVDSLKPDIITLDVEMPVMDGITALKEIHKTHSNIPVIMCSSITARGASATINALSSGASDYVTKPDNLKKADEAFEALKRDLIPKIKTFARKKVFARSVAKPVAKVPVSQPPKRVKTGFFVKRPPKIVCIGSSTGGPKALDEVLCGFEKDFPLPIAIVQHMPTMFTEMLAKRLDAMFNLKVCEASDGDIMKPGHVYIAPGGRHMDLKVEGDVYKIIVHDDPPENSCRPAVDVFFRSAAKQLGSSVLAVVLTGMGHDGLIGCELIKEKGGQVIVQDEETSVVWGMPGCVANDGLADEILPLKEIVGEINKRVR